MTHDLAAAQADMRSGYCSGGAGVLASALAWGAAAVTAWLASPQQAVWALFVGGMLIHPVGVLICKLLGSRGAHAKGNPLGSLAWASTLWLMFSLPLAYVASLQRIEWFFPAMLLVIGGRYLVFATVYGMRLYWGLGLALAGAGFVLGQALPAPAIGALVGAAIEAAFAAVALIEHRRWLRSAPSTATAPLGHSA